jgi:gliding motility-associated-like protein
MISLLITIKMKKRDTIVEICARLNLIKRLLLSFFATFVLLESGYAVSISSIGSGNWNSTTTWSTGTIPTAADDVTITGGNTVTINAAGAVCKSVTIGGTLTLNNQGLTVDGAWTNNGTFNAGNNAANIITFGTGGSIGGSNATTFYGLTINTTSATDVVSLITSGATVANGGSLNLTNGIFKIGAANTFNMGTSGATTINATSGNLASTGVNGSDGGTIIVDQNGGGGNAFTVNATSGNVLQFYNLQFGTTVGAANNNWQITNSGSTQINGKLTVQDNNWNLGNGNPPIYGANSTLSINNNNQGMNAGSNAFKLWTANSGTIGTTPGYPNNLIVTNVGNSNGNVGGHNYGWLPTGTLGINGTFSAGDGGASNGQISFASLTSFTCGGIAINNNSYFNAAPVMTVNGSWFRAASATFLPNGGSIAFGNGTATCSAPNTINTGSGSETFNTISLVSNANLSLSVPVTVSGLTLTSGILTTSAANSLTVTNTATNGITGGSSNAYINGPVQWNVAAAAGNYSFPVGSGTCVPDFLPFTLTKVASSALTATVQAITPGSGGTVDATMSSLSTTEYWSLATSVALPTGSTVFSIARPTAIAPFAYVAESKTTSAGTYTSLAGSAGATGVSNSNDIGAGSTYFFTFGSPPIVSTLAATSITTTGATLQGAFNTGSSKTTSFSYGLTTAYGTTVNSIHSPINSSTSVLDSQAITGLTANTVYHYLASDGTDQGSDVTFVTAPNPPSIGAPNSPTGNGFTATWNAPAAMGAASYTYTIQVSSDPTFATGSVFQTGISSGSTSYTFTTLASATQYYYRVEAVNATASSVWSANSTPISTTISATPACTTGNGSPGTTGTISSASTAPVIDGVIDPVWSTVPSNNISQKINVNAECSPLQATPNNTATWKTIWDVNYLYILVQIQDATLISQGPLAGATDITPINPGYNLWDVDGIEFYLDGDNSKGGNCGGGSYDGLNDFQLRFNLGNGTITGSTTVASGNISGGVNFSMPVVGGGYLLEARIPWNGPGGINSSAYPSIVAGNTIGIDFSINDNDATTSPSCRSAQTGWYDGLGSGCPGSTEQYHIPNLFGTAKLATCPQPPVVVMPTVTNITSTGATLGATVTSSGDAPLTARGTGYTASPINTGTSNAVPEAGTGITAYAGPARTGLLPQTKYYFLGYANNSNNETGVSAVDSFYTLSALPTVQPVLSSAACTQMVLNWTAVAFPATTQATQSGYLLIRSTAPSVPSTAGIATRVATVQGALSAGNTLVATIPNGSTLTYTDATAVAGTAYNYMLVPYTWDGVAADSTYNYFTINPPTVSATINGALAAPGASATQQPTCAAPTGTITINPLDNTLTYSVDGTNFSAGPTFANLTPQTYNVVAKNASGCVSSATPVTINAVAGAPTTPAIVATQPTCATPTGTITISPWDNTLTYSVDGVNFLAGPTFSALTSKTYNVSSKNALGCLSPDTSVVISPTPGPAAPAALVVQPPCGDSIGSIVITPIAGLTYSIDGVNYVGYQNAVFSKLNPGTYQLTAENNLNCVSVATPFTITAVSCIFIPNLITPNNDGKNDLFEITALPSGSSLKVYNRWGDSVYQSNDYDNLWAANNISDGVYYYDLVLPGGKKYNGWLNVVK